MADFKRLTISLSFFATDQSSKSPNSTSNSKSPRNFEKSGIVGLGIVAAMNDLEVARHQAFFSAKSAILAVKSPRSNSSNSNPIPIISASAKSAAFKSREESDSDRDLMELSESYTCVIARIGNDLVKKCEYFDDGCVQYLTKNPIETSTTTDTTGDETANARLVSEEVLNSSFRTADFLNSCFLCKKKLHGLDIFMYRGEKGFCSAECRSKHIASEDHQEKCGSGAMKSMDYSVSPCSSPMLFFAGVAVA